MFEPAPLIDVPEDPVPPGAEPEWFVGAGGAKLRAALFTPKGRLRGSVVLSGGRTEPIEKYFETIGDFMERGFVVLAHDWRGQGLSARELPDRLKGHAKGYRSFLEDYRRLLNTFEPRLPRPWIAVGHSMGGCLTLLAMANGEKRFAGAVLSAPMLGLRLGRYNTLTAGALTGLSMAFGRAGRYMLGQAGAPLDEVFEGNKLTHDPRRFERYRAQVRACPDLALGAPTWGWIDFALKATAVLARPERLRGVTVPVDIVCAGEDEIVDNAAQSAAARNLPQGRLITVPGAHHEILMETDDMRNFFLRVFDTLAGKTAPKPASAPKPAPAATPAPVAAPVAEAPKPAPAAPAPAPAPVAKAPAARKAPARKAAAPKTAVASKPAATKAPPKKAAVKAVAKPAAKAVAPVKVALPKPAAKAKPAPKAVAAKPAPKAAAKPAAAKTAAKAKPAPKPAAKPAATKPAPKAAEKTPAAKAPALAKKAAAVAKKPSAVKKGPAKSK